MGIASTIKTACQRNGLHPRRWLTGLISYPRFLGYVKPQLMNVSEAEFLVRRKVLARAWEPRVLEAPVGKRLLALSPHADDESIGAGGLLLAHRDTSEIHLVCLCNGEQGGSIPTTGLNPEELRRKLVDTRKAELQRTAEALKAKSVHYFDYPDGQIPCTTEATERLRTLVQEIRPDTVLLPWFFDGHVDHRQTNALYTHACSDLDAVVLAYEVWSMMEPNAIFDITDVLPEKGKLIENYTSQLRTVDYATYAASLARVRAYHASLHPLRAGAAEAFLALPNRDYCELVSTLYKANTLVPVHDVIGKGVLQVEPSIK